MPKLLSLNYYNLCLFPKPSQVMDKVGWVLPTPKYYSPVMESSLTQIRGQTPPGVNSTSFST
jgi:hypothetical protein